MSRGAWFSLWLVVLAGCTAAFVRGVQDYPADTLWSGLLALTYWIGVVSAVGVIDIGINWYVDRRASKVPA